MTRYLYRNIVNNEAKAELLEQLKEIEIPETVSAKLMPIGMPKFPTVGTYLPFERKKVIRFCEENDIEPCKEILYQYNYDTISFLDNIRPFHKKIDIKDYKEYVEPKMKEIEETDRRFHDVFISCFDDKSRALTDVDYDRFLRLLEDLYSVKYEVIAGIVVLQRNNILRIREDNTISISYDSYNQTDFKKSKDKIFKLIKNLNIDPEILGHGQRKISKY